MGVRRHLLVFLVFAMVTAAAGAGLGALLSAEAQRQERELAPVLARAEAAGTLDKEMSRYGEAVANVVLVGRDSLDGLQAARIAVTRALARLTQATRNAISGLADSGAVAEALPGLEDAQRIAELYYAIDRSSNQAISNKRDLQTAVAIEIFRREVAFRLDNEVQPLLDAAAQSASADADAVTSAAKGRTDLIRLWGFAAVALLGLGTLCTGLLFLRHERRRESQRQAALERAQAETMSARDVAREELARRESFFTDVSHELRTPLTVLRGEADVGLRGAPDAAALRASLERVRAEAETMSGLIDDLLSLARADAEAAAAEPDDIPLAAFMADIVAEGRVLGATREVSLRDTFTAGAAQVRGSAGRLRRAVLNGIDNAIKHTAPGGVVEVLAGIEDGTAVIRVRDSGPGIAEAEKDRLFERFFRGAGETELENPGLGIGLAIARDIVRAHEGSISLGNRAEGGAELVIRLPLAGEAGP